MQHIRGIVPLFLPFASYSQFEYAHHAGEVATVDYRLAGCTTLEIVLRVVLVIDSRFVRRSQCFVDDAVLRVEIVHRMGEIAISEIN